MENSSPVQDMAEQEIRSFQIFVYGADALRQKCEYFKGLNDALIEASLKAVCAALGARGMAANQLGFTSRMCAVRLNDGNLIVMRDPKIMASSESEDMEREYCYSIPGFSAFVVRPKEVTVSWQDANGDVKTGSFSGTEARTAQHEIDHLDGKMISEAQVLVGRSTLKTIIRKFKKAGYFYKVDELGRIDNQGVDLS